MNFKEGCTVRLILAEFGNPQPPTPVHCDNATLAGIANTTTKKQHSHSMEIQFFNVYEQVIYKQYDVRWHPGQENLGYYTMKYHLTCHHIQLLPIYLQMNNSHRLLPRAMTPSNIRGCVGKSAGG